jgi:hypothetical protein
MPYLIHVAVGAVALVVFIGMDGVFVIGELELEFTTRAKAAMMHTEQVYVPREPDAPKLCIITDMRAWGVVVNMQP